MNVHKSVRLTAKMLDALNPCEAGFAAVQKYLPVDISSDPDDNLKLALRLADSARANCGYSDVYWLSLKLTDHNDEYPDGDYWLGDRYRHISDDPMLVAQYLAMVADAILTRSGR